ncbi:MAG TPA: extracellular solute-binding protein [Anaerolineae bacterium]|nr:extracellular solute-binding protein [Anaerolineae bacterium]
MWTIEPFSPSQTGESGRILSRQLADFEAAHPDVTVEHILKKPYGKGGILDFLRTASAAAPAVLPDLVAIDMAELGQAARAGLVQPLDDLISAELAEDLFPFAGQACRLEGQLVGIPFEADVEHLAYNSGKLESPPLTWTDVLTEGITCVFPAGGERVSNAFLIQYLAAGGRLFDEDGKPALDEDILAEVLEFYRDGREIGVIPSSVLEFKTLDDCWSLYLSAKTTMAHVSSQRFMADRALLKNTAFAPIPTRDGAVVTIAWGWAWAVVTDDPARRNLAARLVEWLLKPENSAAWNRAAGHLPTRRAAFEVWGTRDPYIAFLKGQLEAAHVRPSGPDWDEILAALQKAVRNVLMGEATPKEAAASALAAIER